MEQVILALCLNFKAPTEACYNALLAATIQSGVKQKTQQFQEDIEQRARRQINEAVWLMAGFAYTLKQQDPYISLPIYPVADNLTIKKYYATLTWNY